MNSANFDLLFLFLLSLREGVREMNVLNRNSQKKLSNKVRTFIVNIYSGMRSSDK